MQSVEFEILWPHGFHLRPAARFVEAAKAFQSQIELEADGQTVNGKSLFELQTLELPHGAKGLLKAKGADETEALTRLQQFFGPEV